MLFEVVYSIVDFVALQTAWYGTMVGMGIFLAVHSTKVAKAVVAKGELFVAENTSQKCFIVHAMVLSSGLSCWFIADLA